MKGIKCDIAQTMKAWCNYKMKARPSEYVPVGKTFKSHAHMNLYFLNTKTKLP